MCWHVFLQIRNLSPTPEPKEMTPAPEACAVEPSTETCKTPDLTITGARSASLQKLQDTECSRGDTSLREIYSTRTKLCSGAQVHIVC